MAVDKLTSWRLGLTPSQMREVDRLAEVDYGLSPLQLMEVAGLQTARVVREILGPLAGRAVCILAGKGNNGGDGLVAARRLAGWGAEVTVVTAHAAGEGAGLSAIQARSVAAAGVAVRPWTGGLPPAEIYVDALLGFGATGAPHGPVAEMISATPVGRAVLALDLPSGVDALSGDAAGACVRAGATVTLAAPKVGLMQDSARNSVGTLYLADIGIPPALLRRVGIDPTGLFELGDIEVLVGGATST
jgi:hydroxyethylthiazole kinase-like uncharacterized protein yjeF